MLERLQQVTLKSGESAEVVRITAPEPSWRERILPFLAHKGPLWDWPMQQALTAGLPPLAMRFYLLLVGEEVAGNITTVETLDRPVGILQHVYTNPDHRRKGICQVLMQVLGDDFVARGGRALYLGTDYDSPPYWIYHSFGFQGLGESGAMRWLPEENFDATYFAPGPVTVRKNNWGDWPLLEALYLSLSGWFLRGYLRGQFGPSSYEGPYLQLAEEQRAGRVGDSQVLVTAAGAVVGHAYIGADQRWPGQPRVLDCFVHPAFTGQTATLLQALRYPADRPVWAYAEAGAEGKAEGLQAVGFTCQGVLPGLLQRGEEGLNLEIYRRG